MSRAPYYDPGRYWGKITRQALGQSSKGNPQLVITFLVLGRMNPEDPEGELLPCGQNYERSVYRTITDKTIDYVLEDLATLGFNGTSFGQLDPGVANHQSFIGQELALSCNHEPHYETGQPREVWGIARDGSGPVIKPLEPQAVRKLDALFGKALKAHKPAAKPAVKPESKAEENLASQSDQKPTPPKPAFPDPNAQFSEAGAQEDIPF